MIRSIVNIIIVFFSTFVTSIGALCTLLIDRSGNRSYDIFARLWAYMLTAGCKVHIQVRGVENIDTKKPYVFMTNHGSHFDTPVIIRSLPVRLYFVAKQELANMPFLGFGMKALDMIFIDRSNPEASKRSLAEAAKIVRGGKSVLMFPEGTRSKDGITMRPFKKGGFHLALQAKTEVLPMVLLGTGKILPKGKLLIRPGEVEIRIGEALPVIEGETVEGLRERTREAMQSLIDG